MQWKKLSSKIVHQNPWYSVREDDVIRPDGSQGKYFVMEPSSSVIIIPFDGEHFYLVQQYRYTVSKELLCFPAGHCSTNDPRSDAKRELEEETGFTSDKITYLGQVAFLPGTSSAVGHVFLAEQLTKGVTNRESSESDMRLYKLTPDELKEIIQQAKLVDDWLLSPILLLHLKTDIKIF